MFDVLGNKIIHWLVFGVLASAVQTGAWACEPADMDWQAFVRLNDVNRDGVLQRSELVKPDFGGLNYQRFERDPSAPAAFADLDRNRDGRLNQEEWTGLYLYLPNPCVGWPWH